MGIKRKRLDSVVSLFLHCDNSWDEISDSTSRGVRARSQWRRAAAWKRGPVDIFVLILDVLHEEATRRQRKNIQRQRTRGVEGYIPGAEGKVVVKVLNPLGEFGFLQLHFSQRSNLANLLHGGAVEMYVVSSIEGADQYYVPSDGDLLNCRLLR